MKERIGLLVTETAAEHPAGHELEQLLAQPVEQKPRREPNGRIYGVVVGTLIGFSDPHGPLVIYPGQSGTAALTARASVDLYAEDIGQEVTLVLEDGDPAKPIIIGR